MMLTCYCSITIFEKSRDTLLLFLSNQSLRVRSKKNNKKQNKLNNRPPNPPTTSYQHCCSQRVEIKTSTTLGAYALPDFSNQLAHRTHTHARWNNKKQAIVSCTGEERKKPLGQVKQRERERERERSCSRGHSVPTKEVRLH